MSIPLRFTPVRAPQAPVTTREAPRMLFDRWLEQWARRAEARWRRAGDPHAGRYY